MAAGFIRSSPSEIVPNSAGMPPASSMPWRTAPASARNGRLQGFRSLAELAMPITWRPRPPTPGARPRSAPAAVLWSWRRLRDTERGRGGAGLEQVKAAALDPLQGHGGAVHLLPRDQGRLVHQVQAAGVQRARVAQPE